MHKGGNMELKNKPVLVATNSSNSFNIGKPEIKRVTPVFMAEDSGSSSGGGSTTYSNSCSPCTPCYPDSSGPCSPCTPCYPNSSGPCSPCNPCYPDS